MKYNRYLSKTLRETAEEFSNDPDKLRLYDELTLLRMTLVDAVRVWDAATISEKDDLRMGAGSLMRAIIAEIRQLAHTIAQIETRQTGAYNPAMLLTFVEQVQVAVFDVCGDKYPSIAEQLADRIRTTVNLTDDSNGTRKMPVDTLVTAMDNTIPPVRIA